MLNLQLDRRKQETIVLALIGLGSIVWLRFPIELRSLMIGELTIMSLGFLAMAFARSRNRHGLARTACVVVCLTPIISAIVARRVGSPAAFELTGMTTFGAGALVMAAMNHRFRSMSLVASGFLTLFGTVISDNQSTVWISILWMTVCVWHLVANHWERIDLCNADEIQRSGSIRPMTVLIAVGLFVIGGLLAKDRFSDPTHLQGGIMPTSGGSQWSDPGATHGLGSGDAVVAGKEDAQSFGAVESELFLESTDSTLFDMFSDSIGQPKKKNKWERRQGMSSEKVIEAHGHTARSDKGSNSFSTDRMQPKKHQHLKDVAKNALVQWAGPTGIRLAMNRYDTYDGFEWSNEANHRQEKFVRKPLGEQIWFFDPKTATEILDSKSHQITRGKLKVIRLETTRVPTPMMTSGVHIKDIDRPDFFGLENDGSFFMPGREKVPALTVVNIAGLAVMEDELIKRINDRTSHRTELNNKEVDAAITEWVDRWTADESTDYGKLRAIVHNLRNEFTFDRMAEFDGEAHILQFLKDRRGGDHLFATAAALMARKIGLDSRLVSGLYVRPSSIDFGAGHSNVLPDDVHTWVEVRLDNKRWFEIEPTPGYQEPRYEMSWWLASKRFAAEHWMTGVACTAAVAFAYLTRLIWMNFLLTLLWWCSAVVGPRRRLAFAVKVVEARARLLGHARPAASPPREWLLHEVTQVDQPDKKVRGIVESFCDLADRLSFGPATSNVVERGQLQVASGLVDALPMKTLRKTFVEDNS